MYLLVSNRCLSLSDQHLFVPERETWNMENQEKRIRIGDLGHRDELELVTPHISPASCPSHGVYMGRYS